MAFKFRFAMLNSAAPIGLVGLALASAVPLVWVSPARAQAVELPSGGTVAQGSATIGARVGDSITVTQSSERAVVNWNSFSVDAGGSVVFSQPSASSVILNRVTGGAVSTLAGQVQSNGQVFLVNPNGVTVSSTGQVSATGGFLASTLDITDTDFMNGDLRFAAASGGSGAVTNAGTINSGAYTVLLGTRVASEGIISVPSGKVGLGAGTAATLDLSGTGFLQVTLPADATDASGRALIDHSGTITADGGRVVIRASVAQDAVRRAVNISGSIQARRVSSAGGEIILEAATGGDVVVASGATLDSSQQGSTAGTTGGTISVSAGRDITVAGTLKATGPVGGSITAAAGRAFSLTGTANADGTSNGGTIRATTSTGALTASGTMQALGGTGGRIDVTGDTVALTGARLDVTGTAAGGLIRIGGMFQNGVNDGSQAWNQFAGRFSGSTNLALARRVTVDATTQLEAKGGVGGGVVVNSSEDTAFTARPHTGAATGTLSIASEGLVSQLPVPPEDDDLDVAGWINVGARRFEVGSSFTADTAATKVTLDQIHSVMGGMENVLFHASEGIKISGGVVNPNPGLLRRFLLRAKGDITITGDLNTGNAFLLLHAGWPGATNVSSGAGSLNLRQANLASYGFEDRAGDISLTALDDIDLPAMDGRPTSGSGNMGRFGSLTLSAGHRIIFNGDVRVPDSIIRNGLTTRPRIQLTGPLAFRTSTEIYAGFNTVTWSGRATDTVTGLGGGTPGFRAQIALVSQGNPILRGALGDGTAAVVDLGGLGSAPAQTYGITGAEAGALALRLLSGSLPSGSSLTPALVGATLTVTAPTQDRLNVGTHAISVSAAARRPTGTDTAGVVFLSGSGSGNVTIQPRVVTASATSVQTMYGSAPTLGAQFSGLLSGDQLTPILALSRGGSTVDPASRLAVGDYTSSVTGLTGSSAGNYILAASGNSTGTVTVTPRPVTWSVVGRSVAYGDAVGLQGALDGVLSGDDLVAVTGLTRDGQAVALGSRLGVGTYGGVVTGLTGAAAANYSLASTGNTVGTVTITPRQITGSFIGRSLVYGDPFPTLTGSLSGVLDGDTVTAVVGLTRDGRSVDTATRLDVGAYTGTVTGLSGASAANYTLASGGGTTGTLTVTPRPLSWSFTTRSFVYGDTPVLDDVLTGVLSGDVVRGVVQFTRDGRTFDIAARLNVGTYGGTVTALTGAAAANYILAPGGTPGTVTITPRPVSWRTTTRTATYGDALAFDDLLTGVLGGDALKAVVELTRDGKTVDAAGRLRVGTYGILVKGLSGEAAANYSFVASDGATGSLRIDPRRIRAVGRPVSLVYGGRFDPLDAFIGVLADDDVRPVFSGIASNGRYITVGTYNAFISDLAGADKDNYRLETASTAFTLTVTPRPLAVRTDGRTITYLDATPTLGLSLEGQGPESGLLAGDDVSGTVELVDYETRRALAAAALAGRLDAGQYAVRFVGLTGSDARNYAPVVRGEGLLRVNPYKIDLAGFTLQWGDQKAFATARISEAHAAVLRAAGITLTFDGTIAEDVRNRASQRGVGQYSVSPLFVGTTARNFTTGQGTTILDITPRTVTYRIFEGGFAYGSRPAAFFGTLRNAPGNGIPDATQSLIIEDSSLVALYLDEQRTRLGSSERIAADGRVDYVVPGSYFAGLRGLPGVHADNLRLVAETPTTGAMTVRRRTVSIASLVGSPRQTVFTGDGLFEFGARGTDSTGLLPEHRNVFLEIRNADKDVGEAKFTSFAVLQGTPGQSQLTQVAPYYEFVFAGGQTVSLKPIPITVRLNPSGVYGQFNLLATIDETRLGESLRYLGRGASLTSLGSYIPELKVTDYTGPARTASGLLSPLTRLLEPGQGGQLYTDFLANAGTYKFDLISSNPFFEVVNGTGLTFVVRPRPIDSAIQLLGDGRITFGDRNVPLLSFTSVRPQALDLLSPYSEDDQVFLERNPFLLQDASELGSLEPVYSTTSDALKAFLTNSRNIGNGSGRPVDVGLHMLAISGLTGPLSANYTLARRRDLALIVEPRPLVFRLDTNRIFGDQAQIPPFGIPGCDANCGLRPNPSPFIRLSNVVNGTDVGLTVTLIGADGKEGAYGIRTNAGTYAIRVDAISGADAKNYVIDEASLKAAPLSMTIRPAPVGYYFLNSYTNTPVPRLTYVRGIGYVGPSPEAATLHGIVGDDVVVLASGFVPVNGNGIIYLNPDLAPPGEYVVQPVQLITATSNYVLGPLGGLWGQVRRELTIVDPAILAPLLAPAIQSRSTITTTGGAAVRLNYTLSTGAALSMLPTLPTPSAQTPPATQSQQSSSSQNPTMPGASTSADAKTTTSQSQDVGSATNTNQAEAGGKGSATAGPTGAKAKGSAEAEISSTISYGPGYTAVGLSGEVKGELGAGFGFKDMSPKVYYEIGARLDAFVATGISGGLGNGATGSAEGKATMTLIAEQKQEFVIKDGKLATNTYSVSGAGFTAGGTAGVGGQLGDVNAGATVFSPGINAIVQKTNVGYENGKVTVDLSFGGSTALTGGVVINLNFAIDPVEAFSALGDAMRAISVSVCTGGCLLERDGRKATIEATREVLSLDPIKDAKKIHYLVAERTDGAFRDNYGVLDAKTRSQFKQWLITSQAVNDANGAFDRELPVQKALFEKLSKDPGNFTQAEWNELTRSRDVIDQSMDGLNKAFAGFDGKAEITQTGGFRIVPNKPTPSTPPSPPLPARS